MNKTSLKQSEPSIFYTRLVGNIDDDTVKTAIEELNIANAKTYVSEISFTLVSYGGDLLYSFALYDHIKASPKPVNIIVEGMCMSAAVMILQAGQKRVSRPHAVFMVHPTITSLEEKAYPEFILSFLNTPDVSQGTEKAARSAVKRSLQRRETTGVAKRSPWRLISIVDQFKTGPHN